MSVRVEFRWPDGLVARVDAARGVGQPRADFVRRAVERALSEAEDSSVREQAGPGSVASSEAVRPAVPAEQLGVVEQASVTGVGGGSPGVSKAGLPAPAEQSRRPIELSGRPTRVHAENCKCPVCS